MRRSVYRPRPSVCLCACLCVCQSVPCRISSLLHEPGCNLGNGRECSLVVHYWTDLQSVHGFRCYDNRAPNAKCQQVPVLPLWLVARMSHNTTSSIIRLRFKFTFTSVKWNASHSNESLGNQSTKWHKRTCNQLLAVASKCLKFIIKYTAINTHIITWK